MQTKAPSLALRLSLLIGVVALPLILVYLFLSCAYFQGSLLVRPASALVRGDLWALLPPITLRSAGFYLVWFTVQVVLATALPDQIHKVIRHYRGGKQFGRPTEHGGPLSYQINGLQEWLISQLLFFGGAYLLGWWSPTIILDNWGALLWITTLFGTLVGLFVYLKGHLFPSDPRACELSGSRLYDFFLGIELNPRIGKFDFKLFFNGRIGITAWTLINASFAAYQVANLGRLTNSMILVNLLQGLYVISFFYNEASSLKTVDITRDRFGWMVAWGDTVWLPYFYTLQGLYLAYNPVDLSLAFALFVLVLGLASFALLQWINAQKSRFRRSRGQCKIWGKAPGSISVTYRLANGESRQSQLLASGWWGVARRFNYTADLIGCAAYGLACGFGSFIPYIYLLFMMILLVQRCQRDEAYCHEKYGEQWLEYCRKVPYRFIPGIY